MKKKFCVVGLGVVGRSFLEFYKDFPEKWSLFLNNYIKNVDPEVEWKLALCEDRMLTTQEAELCTNLEVTVFNKATWNAEKENIDLAWFSTGIDQTDFSFPLSKIIKEIDLFQFFWKKPIISITGTYGKTTTTQLIKEILSLDSCAHKEREEKETPDSFYNNKCTHLAGCSYRRIGLAGNIGKGLCDLVPHEPILHAAVIELSSWQLEQNRTFAPEIGLWMNLSENHLDRHGSLEAYFNAKASFLTYQTENQSALLDESLLSPQLRSSLENRRKTWKSKIFFVFTRLPSNEEFEYLDQQKYSTFFIDQDIVYQQTGHQRTPLFSTSIIPKDGFLQSWIFALATAYLMDVDCTMLSENICQEAYQKMKTAVGTHRLEAFLSSNEITFYNDSKATIQQATTAAIMHLAKTHNKIALILGGLSKGADRSSLIRFVTSHPQIIYVATFGPGAKDLKGLTHFETLELLMHDIKTKKDQFDALLFSPSGSSYDLYKDYKARGEHFKLLAEII